MSTKRIAYWDISKCFAMFLVVWGHSLQNLTVDNTYYSNDLLSECIISFHMALFMLVSGYFAFSSLSKPLISVISRRSIQILLPSITWFIAIRSAAHFASGNLFSVSALLDLLLGCLTSFWFLKALFMCYLITMVGSWIFKKSPFLLSLYIIIIIACGEWLNYSSTVSMLPFFICGLILKRYESWVFSHTASIMLLTGLIWGIVLVFFDVENYSIYHKPFSFEMEGVISWVIRTLAGLSGSLFFLLLIRYVFEKNESKTTRLLAKTGSMTLGIYCLQVFFAEVGARQLAPYLEFIPRAAYDVIVTPLYAIAVMTISVAVITVIRKNKYTRLLMLGER